MMLVRALFASGSRLTQSVHVAGVERRLLCVIGMTVQVLGRVVAECGGSSEPAEGVREVVGSVMATPDVRLIGRALLDATRVSCRATNAVGSAGQCTACERFVNYRPSADRKHVTVRCSWTGRDQVRSLMRPVDSVLVVPRDSTLGQALRLANEYEQRYVMVVDDGILVGLLDTASVDTRRRLDDVRAHMSRQLWVTFPDATLADARRIMLDNGVDVLPVIDGTRLRGTLLREDLVEVGLL